ncbi:hypothetical protein DES38_10620 [Streptohalobacillus salinus]|uniref:Zn-finger containing protein n=1 Tax=Streptohalobacillus salinus TaxID=621096 RepID=A0A2V3WBS4_9BACI|nr:hypothetical protein [Streptohalobacillus salinus]PXW90986.1 hypothetical protein DES38_10620 [Streptohalobacillus salinus]
MKEKIIAFMRGRNGTDQLYVATLIAYFIVLFLSRYLYPNIMSALMTLLIIVAVFRIFSKNIQKRQQENRQYLYLVNKVKRFFKKLTQRMKDLPTKRYRKCSNCAVVLRLDRKIGTNQVVCPRCGHRFNVVIKW